MSAAATPGTTSSASSVTPMLRRLRNLKRWQRWAIFIAVVLTVSPAEGTQWWAMLIGGFMMPYGIVWAAESVNREFFRRVGWIGIIGGTLNMIPVGWHDWWVAVGTLAGGLVAFLINWWRKRKIRQKLMAGWARERAIIAGMVRTMRERAPRVPVPVPS